MFSNDVFSIRTYPCLDEKTVHQTSAFVNSTITLDFSRCCIALFDS